MDGPLTQVRVSQIHSKPKPKYMRAIFEFVEANPDQFDSSRMYAEGFSQNSMFSAYIGHCFNENVLGVWQGGSGMGLTGQLPYFPGILTFFDTNPC